MIQIRKHNLGTYVVPEDTIGGNCIDIGCNVGGFIKRYANHFKRIDYYEPIKRCFNICQNFSINHNHITGYNLAAWSESNKNLNVLEHLNKDSGSSAIESNLLDYGWAGKNIIQKIKTISLEDILSRFDEDIDYCKCDCENSEYFIFLNKDISRIKYIGLELHGQMGKDKQQELLNHMLKTHKIVSVYGSCPLLYFGLASGIGREILLERKE